MQSKIKISGVEGDKVVLYLDGYIRTKYGEFYKIEFVDQVAKEVQLYGGVKYNYSRISSSCPIAKDSNNEYLTSLKLMFDRLKIKKDSIINFKFSETDEENKLEVLEIIYPTLKGNDYLPKLKFKNLSTLEESIFILYNFDYFQRNNLISVDFTPYSLEERLENIFHENTNYGGTIKDKKVLIKSLEELVLEYMALEK